MTEESLSEKEMKKLNVSAYWKGDVKEKIQNAQKRLKEDIEFRKQFGQISIAEIEIISEIINRIFSEEFGEKLIK